MANGAKQKKQVVDFNKLRKKRQRATTVRRMLILSGILLLFFGLVFLNNILVAEGFNTRISDLTSGFGGSGYPVPLPGGIIRSVEASGNHLAVLNDTNLYLYNAKGKQVGNFPKMNDNTVLATSPSRLLTFDIGARRYAVHSKSKTLIQQDMEYSIMGGTINSRGDYAIISESKQAICEINVYNKRFDNVYTCTFAENFVYHVGISPRGNMMAAGWINTEAGVLLSGVNLYQLSSDQIYATVEFPDNMLLGVYYLEDDRVAVLTDRQYLILSADGKVKSSYGFGGKLPMEIRQEGKQTLLLLEDKETRTWEVVLLDGDLEERGVQTTSDKIIALALSPRRVYLLKEDTIFSYNMKLELDKTEQVEHVSQMCMAGNKLYYLDRENICQLGQTEPVADPLGQTGTTGLDDEDADDAGPMGTYGREETGDTDASDEPQNQDVPEDDPPEPEDDVSGADALGDENSGADDQEAG